MGWNDFIHGAKTFFTGGYNDQINQGIKNVGNKIKESTNTVRDQANKVISDVTNGIKIQQNEIQNLMKSAEITANQKWDLMKAWVKNQANKVSERCNDWYKFH